VFLIYVATRVYVAIAAIMQSYPRKWTKGFAKHKSIYRKVFKMKDLSDSIDMFLNSSEYKAFTALKQNYLDTKLACLGINFTKDSLHSIKQYYAYKNKEYDVTQYLSIPSFKTLAANIDTDTTTTTSPSIALKYYPGLQKFTKYFHMKFNFNYYVKNKKYFTPKYNNIDTNNIIKTGISIEDKTLIKYFYIKPYLQLMPIIARKFNINTINNYEKIEYVEYKNKYKFIIDSVISKNTLVNTDWFIDIIDLVENKYNLKFSTGGKDSTGTYSLYFF